MITFRAIDEDNFDTIINMKPSGEKKFIAENSVSLAQCWLYRNNGDVFPCAIYNDDVPVGFLLLEEDMDENKLMIWRMMIDASYTCRGYATEAVGRVIELARESGRYDALYLDCNPENAVAVRIYLKAGFEPTGEINHGDLEMKYNFR